MPRGKEFDDPDLVVPWSGGSILFFHGTPSTLVPMELRLDLHFKSPNAFMVTPTDQLGTLTPSQEQEVFNSILGHTQNLILAQQLFNQKIVIDPDDNEGFVVSVLERQPAEMKPRLAVIVKGGVQEASVDMRKGDGLFQGSPSQVIPFSAGTILLFHGTPSIGVPMKLHIDLTFRN